MAVVGSATVIDEAGFAERFSMRLGIDNGQGGCNVFAVVSPIFTTEGSCGSGLGCDKDEEVAFDHDIEPCPNRNSRAVGAKLITLSGCPFLKLILNDEDAVAASSKDHLLIYQPLEHFLSSPNDVIRVARNF